MTFAEMKGIVSRNAKADLGSEDVEPFIEDCINVAMYEIARERPWPQLLQINFEPSMAAQLAGTGSIIDSKFMIVDRVRYIYPTRTWGLQPRQGMVPPAPILNKPRAFFLFEGQRIQVEPFKDIDIVNDRITVDWYRSPVALTDETQTAPGNMWDAEIIKRAEAYALTYYSKIDEAKQTCSMTLAAMKSASNQQQQ